MGSLAPTLLWGLIAVSIPIALHFFYRSRFRTVPWAAMSFLLTSIEQTSRRLRFQELLLLALRVLLLLLLAFALARPTTQLAGRAGAAKGQSGDAIDVVFVIDTSLSMGAKAGVAPPLSQRDAYLEALRSLAKPDGSVTRFDRARAAALALLDSLPPNSTIQIIAAGNRGGTLLGPRAPSQLDQARTLLETLERTDAPADLLSALRLAEEVVTRGSSPGKEVYLFSDMHKLGFDSAGPALRSALDNLRSQAVVSLVHCAHGPLANVANVSVVGITPQSTLYPGERASFAVLLRNHSNRPVRNLTVTLEVDGQADTKESRPVELLKPGESQAVLLSGVLNRPGFHQVSATVRPDDLDADNQFTSILRVREAVGVLVVDGKPNPAEPKRSASFFLQHALNPATPDAEEPLPLTVVPAAHAEPRHLAGKNLCVLVNASVSSSDGNGLSGEFIRALNAFVQERHSLMIFPGDNVDVEAYNRKLYTETRLLPYPIASILSSKRAEAQPEAKSKLDTKNTDTLGKGIWSFDRASSARIPFERFREEEGYVSLGRIEIRRALALKEKQQAEPNQPDPPGEARVWLRYANGKPAIASWQRPGQGEVVLFTTSVNDLSWTDLHLSPAFLPLIQVSLNHLLEARPEQFNGRAGDPLLWSPTSAEASRSFDLVRPNGQKSRLGYPDTVSGRPLVTALETTQAGLYRIEPTDGSTVGVPFALTPDTTETADLTVLSPEEIDKRLGVTVIHQIAGDEVGLFSGSTRMSQEWTPWLLTVLLVLVLFECGLAWFCGRPVSGPTDTDRSQT